MKKTKFIPPNEISALLDKAELHLEKSEYVQAEKLANDILSLAKRKGIMSQEDESRTLCILGDYYFYTTHYDDALAHYDNAFSLAETASNLSLQCRALNGTALVYVTAKLKGLTGSESNLALHKAERALAFAEKAEDKKQQARALLSIASMHYALVDYVLALDYLTHGLALAEDVGDKKLAANILNNCGAMYIALADYQHALDYLSRGLALAEEIGNKVLVAISLENIGIIYSHIGDFTRALDYNFRSLILAEELGETHRVAKILHNRATYLDEKGDKSALEYFHRALQINIEIGARQSVGYCMANIANFWQKHGDLNAANQGLLDSLNYRRNVLKTNENVAPNLLNLGSVLLEQGKTQEGLVYLKEALILSQELGEKLITSELYKEIADAYSQMGDMAGAFEHLKKHLALDKEIFSEESKKKIETFNMRVAIAEKEIQTEVQKLRAEQFEKENKIQQLELEKNEQDLANSAIHLATQTEMLGNFRNEMRTIVREINEPISALKRIKEKLKELPCESVDWVKFEKEFTAVHPEFRAKLIEKYPELTKQETKMCQLARLGLKTYEMSRLLCLSERTIDGHRNGLRKKMGIKANENLKDFLQGIR